MLTQTQPFVQSFFLHTCVQVVAVCLQADLGCTQFLQTLVGTMERVGKLLSFKSPGGHEGCEFA